MTYKFMIYCLKKSVVFFTDRKKKREHGSRFTVTFITVSIKTLCIYCAGDSSIVALKDCC